ncbi:MAG: NADP-dependent malic enzyme [Candidatus Micrarchaeota archaeon]|nr:NADP-dependent malic enzyme [Candidatus Micrarchaeota archaeon]
MNGDDLRDETLKAHSARKGKIQVVGKVAINEANDLAMYYTPGVAYPCLEIKNNKDLSYEYTSRGNMVAIITDGTRILGLGNIGPEAGMPVMEGKSVLLKKFGGVDAVPLALDITQEDWIVGVVKALAPSFGAINLEDIETPKAVNILKRLEKELTIPVFHDDSYGTAIITVAALKNALKLVGKKLKSVRIVVNGAGSAGFGITELLLNSGATDVICCDTTGIIYKGRTERMNNIKEELASMTNKSGMIGSLSDAMKGADVLISVASNGTITKEQVSSMAEMSIVLALSNPDPEIGYEDAKAAGAAVVGTGQSGIPNQVNNMLAFPGVFRGLLDVRARRMNVDMMIAAVDAIAKTVGRKQLTADYIVPDFNDNKMALKTTASVAEAVAAAAMKTGVARVQKKPGEIKRDYIASVKRYNRLEKLISKL